MDRDQFFNNLFDDDKFNYQQSYENRAVRRVITECGITPVSWGKLVNQCRDETGLPYFSFHWFNGFFPDFPAKLCGKRIGWCGKILDGSGGYKKVGLYELPLHEILRPKNNLLLRSISNNLEQFYQRCDPGCYEHCTATNQPQTCRVGNNTDAAEIRTSQPAGVFG